MDHRIEITITDEGREAETSDRLVDALYELLPAADAVIDQNLESGVLSAVFVIEADTAADAAKAGIDLFEMAAARAGIASRRVLDVAARRV